MKQIYFYPHGVTTGVPSYKGRALSTLRYIHRAPCEWRQITIISNLPCILKATTTKGETPLDTQYLGGNSIHPTKPPTKGSIQQLTTQGDLGQMANGAPFVSGSAGSLNHPPPTKFNNIELQKPRPALATQTTHGQLAYNSHTHMQWVRQMGLGFEKTRCFVL